MWKIIETDDGTKTLYNADLNESYHSRFGAAQESQHVFIQNGLSLFKNQPVIRVFELGFGTGLNALLTAQAAADQITQIHYTSIEQYPLSSDIIEQLDYSCEQQLFAKIHSALWGKSVTLTEQFVLEKVQGDFCGFVPKQTYDVIYYDAFAPDVQPELWTEDIWNKLAAMTRQGGVIVTYCAKGIVRRGLAAAGFEMERLPGPPGKREMLRGKKRAHIKMNL